MKSRLTYVIKFVADVDKAIAFHRDVLGLALKFASPHWTEFATGEVTLALHPASATKPAGTIELAFGVDDLKTVYAERDKLGINFVSEPRAQFGVHIATFLDSEKTECRMSG